MFVCILPSSYGEGQIQGGPPRAPLIIGLVGKWKESYEMRPYIKFEVNPKSLTHSSVTHKFNDFILKENYDPQSNGPIQFD